MKTTTNLLTRIMLFVFLMLQSLSVYAQDYESTISAKVKNLETGNQIFYKELTIKPKVKFRLSKSHNLLMTLVSFDQTNPVDEVSYTISIPALKIYKENVKIGTLGIDKEYDLGVIKLINDETVVSGSVSFLNISPSIYPFTMHFDLTSLVRVQKKVTPEIPTTKPVVISSPTPNPTKKPTTLPSATPIVIIITTPTRTPYYTPTPTPTPVIVLSDRQIEVLAYKAVQQYMNYHRQQITEYKYYNYGYTQSQNSTYITQADRNEMNVKAIGTIEVNYKNSINASVHNELHNKITSIADYQVQQQVQMIKAKTKLSIDPYTSCSTINQGSKINIDQISLAPPTNKFGFVKTAVDLGTVNQSDSREVYSKMIDHYSRYGLSLENMTSLNNSAQSANYFASIFMKYYQEEYNYLRIDRSHHMFNIGKNNARADKLNPEYSLIFDAIFFNEVKKSAYDNYKSNFNSWCKVLENQYLTSKQNAEKPNAVLNSANLISVDNLLNTIQVELYLENLGLSKESQLDISLVNSNNQRIAGNPLLITLDRLSTARKTVTFNADLSKFLVLGNNSLTLILKTSRQNMQSDETLTYNFTMDKLTAFITSRSNENRAQNFTQVILEKLAQEWDDAEKSKDKKFYQNSNSFMKKLFIAQQKNQSNLKMILTSTANTNFNKALTDIKKHKKYWYFHPWDKNKAIDFLTMYNEMIK